MAAPTPTRPNLAETLGAERIDDVVALVHEDHVDVMHVGVHREMVVREIVGHEAADGIAFRYSVVQASEKRLGFPAKL